MNPRNSGDFVRRFGYHDEISYILKICIVKYEVIENYAIWHNYANKWFLSFYNANLLSMSKGGKQVIDDTTLARLLDECK